jgi:hypothetical protein
VNKLSLILFLSLVISFATSANGSETETDKLFYSDSCRELYSEQYQDLEMKTFEFNSEDLDKRIMANLLINQDKVIKEKQSLCFFAINIMKDPCVTAFKSRYDALRGKWDITELLLSTHPPIDEGFIHNLEIEFNELLEENKCFLEA